MNPHCRWQDRGRLGSRGPTGHDAAARRDPGARGV